MRLQARRSCAARGPISSPAGGLGSRAGCLRWNMSSRGWSVCGPSAASAIGVAPAAGRFIRSIPSVAGTRLQAASTPTTPSRWRGRFIYEAAVVVKHCGRGVGHRASRERTCSKKATKEAFFGATAPCVPGTRAVSAGKRAPGPLHKRAQRARKGWRDLAGASRPGTTASCRETVGSASCRVDIRGLGVVRGGGGGQWFHPSIRAQGLPLGTRRILGYGRERPIQCRGIECP